MIENFNIWCPVEISKAIDPLTGNSIMRLGGIASTSDEDSDGEFLDPRGFDIKPFVEKGIVNWHHQAKNSPMAIIGEPSKAEIKKEGLYIETDLYPSNPIAQEVFTLAETLEKDSSTRRLGFSIEGKVVKRKSNDKKSPLYKKIEKAVITGVAITHQPKNPKTFANIIKGETGEEDEEEKGMDVETGEAVIKESVDKKLKNQTFAKSEILEVLFKDIPGLSINKAEQIYKLVLKIADMKSRKVITEEDITKAYELLGVEDIVPVIEKSEKEEIEKEIEEEAEEETKEEIKEDEETEKAVVAGIIGAPDSFDISGRFEIIEKAISSSHNNTKQLIKATATLVKDVTKKLEESAERETRLMEIIKGQEDMISEISQRIETIGSSVPAPRSIRNAAPVERFIEKSQDDELSNGKNVLSASRNKAAVLDVLDSATFAKGFDNEFSNATTHFEVTGNIPAAIASRLKNEFGINIIK